MANIFQRQVAPVKPKVIEEAQIYVYVPEAEGDNKGVASYNQRDFSLPKGRVSLKWPMEMLVNKLADPLKQPALTKLLEDEFVNTNIQTTVTNPITKVKYTSDTAEVKLNRTHRDALSRPDLVMLHSDDFEASLEGDYNRYRIRVKDPTLTPTLVKVDDTDFKYEEGKVKVKWPYGHDGEYGLVKVKSDGSGSLSFDDHNYLRLDANKFKKNFEDYLAIRPTYGGNWAGKNDYVDAITNFAKRNLAGQTLLKLDKEAIGLENVDNRRFDSRVYNEFGTAMKAHFETEFDNKLDEASWNLLFNDWTQDNPSKNTVQKWFKVLEDTDQSIWDSIKASNLMLGYFSDLTELGIAYPNLENLEGHLAYLLSTATYWIVKDGVWEDTEIEHGDFFSFMETDGTKLKPDGAVGSVGVSGKWVSSDHVHPADPNKLNVDTYEALKVIINEEFEGTISDNEININMTHTPVSKYLHNWKDNPHEFDPTPESEEIYWAGTRAEFEALDTSTIPQNMLIYIRDEDEEEIVPGTLIMKEELDQKGLPIDSYDLLVSVDNIVNLEDKILTLKNYDTIAGVRGPRRELVELVFENTDTNENYDLATIRNNTIEKLSLSANKMMVTGANGKVTTGLSVTDIIRKGSVFNKNQVVVTNDDNYLETTNFGGIGGVPIVTTDDGGIRTTNIANGRLLTLNNQKQLVSTSLIPELVLYTDDTLDNNKLLISDYDNKVKVWSPSNYAEGALLIAGSSEGSIKLRQTIAVDRIMLSDVDGKLKEMAGGNPTQLLALNNSSQPVWINNPLSDGHLSQTVLATNPTLSEAMEFNGLVAVVLNEAPPAGQMWSNCIYYIG